MAQAQAIVFRAPSASGLAPWRERPCQAPGCARLVAGPYHLYCSARCKEHVRHLREMARPEAILANRERCRKWCVSHRGVRHARPWLRGAPPYGQYLPGGATTLSIGTHSVRPGDTRWLHAILTRLVGETHVDHEPAWSLLPWEAGVGWAVYWWSDEHLYRFAGTEHAVRLGKHGGVAARFGPPARMRAPREVKRGHQLVRVDSVTPIVCTSTGRTSLYTAPGATTIVSSLALTLRPRLGLGREAEDVCVRLVSRQTEPVSVWSGDKLGTVRGWHGHVLLDVNATARWLLEAAGRGPGLGGRTAYGFGRVVVSEALQ